MVQAATNGYKRLHGLTIEQCVAVDLLVAGNNDREVAEAIGVHRVTVTKWRLNDGRFLAAVRVRRDELFRAANERLRAALPTAINTLVAAARKGDVRAAAAILKFAGLDKMPLPEAPTDVDAFRMEKEWEAIDEAGELPMVGTDLGLPESRILPHVPAAYQEAVAGKGIA